jgi:hypothetical protein
VRITLNALVCITLVEWLVHARWAGKTAKSTPILDVATRASAQNISCAHAAPWFCFKAAREREAADDAYSQNDKKKVILLASHHTSR